MVEQRGVENAGILVLEAVDADGPVAEYFKSAAVALKLPFYAYRTWARPIARRPDNETSTSPRIGAYQKNAAKWRRQLSEELGGAVTVVDRSADASAIDQLIELEAAGYKARSGVAMVGHRGESDWFREMCAQFRLTNRVLLYSLQVDDRVLAMNLSLRTGVGLFGLQGVYDENYAKFAPGFKSGVASLAASSTRTTRCGSIVAHTRETRHCCACYPIVAPSQRFSSVWGPR